MTCSAEECSNVCSTLASEEPVDYQLLSENLNCMIDCVAEFLRFALEAIFQFFHSLWAPPLAPGTDSA